MPKRCRWPAISILPAVILGAAIYFLLYRLLLLHFFEYPRPYIPVSSGQTSREITYTARLIRPTQTRILTKRNPATNSSLMKTESEKFGNLTRRAPSVEVNGVKKEIVRTEDREVVVEHSSSPKNGNDSVRNVMKKIFVNTENKNFVNTENKEFGILIEPTSPEKKGNNSIKTVVQENFSNIENGGFGNLTEHVSSVRKDNHGSVWNGMSEKGVNVTIKNESSSVVFGTKGSQAPLNKNGSHQIVVPVVPPRVELLNTSRETNKNEKGTKRNQQSISQKFERTSPRGTAKNRSAPLSREMVEELPRNQTEPTSLSVLSDRKATVDPETKRSEKNSSKIDLIKLSLNLHPNNETKQQMMNSSETDFSKLTVDRGPSKETKKQKKNFSQIDFSKFNLDRDPRKKAEFAITLSPSSLVIPNPNLCSDTKEALWVILVHTAISHFSSRQAIRDTWANKYTFRSISLKIVFLVGTTSHARNSENIVIESQKYGDIVQGSFSDSYRNLSTKGIMGFLWVATYCPMADLVIKVDDDVYLNMYKVVQHVFPRLQHRKRHMLCELNRGFPIHRNARDAWYVSEKEFPHFKLYPPFCRGPAVFITPDLILHLLEAARKVPLFWIDDVYLYGMLPLVTGVKFLDFKTNCSNVEKRCLKEYESDLPTNLTVCKATSKDVMYRMWRHGWRRLSENSRHLLTVNFLPAVDNFIRNFPKLEKYEFS